MGVLGALILAAVGIFGIPWTRLALSTVSTDDAYVNGHVTFVAPPVSGQISRVLVDDNYRERKGEVNTVAMARTTQLVQQGFVKITE
jgi:membrane fusion protein (multidrug efflux system)